MTISSEQHTATLLEDGRVLVAAGLGSKTAELYDPATNTWMPTGSITSNRFSHTATLLKDGRVLVAGGYSYFPGDNLTASVDLYDPATDTWTAAAPMTQPREQHTATLLEDGKVLVAGGCCGVDKSAELYDPASDTWKAAATLTSGRSSHTATLLKDGRVLVAGGWAVFGPYRHSRAL